MSFLTKLFSSTPKQQEPKFVPHTFLECLDVVRGWSARAAIDPDFDMNDRDLNAALAAQVTCPYCNARYQFGHAVKFQGAKMEVQCPSCQTIPRKGYQSSN